MTRAACCVALLSLVISCGRTAPSAPVLQAVRAGLVAEITPDAPVRYSAAIVPIAQVDLAFLSAGPVDRLLQVPGSDGRVRSVQAGDRVSRGAELGAVRLADYTDRLHQAQAQVAQAVAQQAQAQAAAKDAAADFMRAQALYQSASLTKSDFDQAEARRDSTVAAQQAAEATVAVARATVDTAQQALEDCVLRAPFDGTITGRQVEIGALVSSVQPAFGLMDTRRVKAEFAVPDSALASVALGRSETVMLDVLPHPFVGTVTSIAPEADPKGRVFSVDVTIDNPSGALRPGMIGTLLLGPPRASTPRLVVPLGAIVRAPNDPNGFAVFRLVDRNGRTYAAAQGIRVGETYGSAIEVIEGLAKGDRVIVLGGGLLRDGQEVRVLP